MYASGQRVQAVQSQYSVKEFMFDACFGPDTTQDKIFDDTRMLIQSAIDGFNVCIFAYGQTGSGKTYTMFGKGFDTNGRERAGTKGQSTVASVADPNADEDRGIIPRSIFELFNQIRSTEANVTVYCSFVQIYNEKIFDLLNDPK